MLFAAVQYLLVDANLAVRRFVLNAAQDGFIAVAPKVGREMLPLVVQPEATMGQAEHSRRMRRHAAQEAGPAGRARRRRAERRPKHKSLFGQRLEPGRRRGIAVRPEPASGVVRVDVDDVAYRHARIIPEHM